MEDCSGLAELADELLDAVLVEEGLAAGAVLLIIALVGEDDLDAGVQEGELTQTTGEALELEGDGDREDLGIWQEGNEGSGLLLVLQLAENGEWLGRLALGKGHEVDLPLAHDLDFEPSREGVDTLGADTVKTAAVLVGSLAELSTGVEVGEDELERGDLELGMHLDRNASAIVTDGDGAVRVDRDLDA